MLESQISTPLTKNTRRKNNNDDDLVASQSNVRKSSRSKTDNGINPPRRDRIRITIGNTDDSRNNDSDLNGCLLMEEIWSIFTSLSSAV